MNRNFISADQQWEHKAEFTSSSSTSWREPSCFGCSVVYLDRNQQVCFMLLTVLVLGFCGLSHLVSLYRKHRDGQRWCGKDLRRECCVRGASQSLMNITSCCFPFKNDHSHSPFKKKKKSIPILPTEEPLALVKGKQKCPPC